MKGTCESTYQRRGPHPCPPPSPPSPQGCPPSPSSLPPPISLTPPSPQGCPSVWTSPFMIYARPAPAWPAPDVLGSTAVFNALYANASFHIPYVIAFADYALGLRMNMDYAVRGRTGGGGSGAEGRGGGDRRGGPSLNPEPYTSPLQGQGSPSSWASFTPPYLSPQHSRRKVGHVKSAVRTAVLLFVYCPACIPPAVLPPLPCAGSLVSSRRPSIPPHVLPYVYRLTYCPLCHVSAGGARRGGAAVRRRDLFDLRRLASQSIGHFRKGYVLGDGGGKGIRGGGGEGG